MITEINNKMFNPDVLTKAKKCGRKSALSDEQKAKAQQLRDEGFTLESIAESFGTSHTTIARWTE